MRGDQYKNSTTDGHQNSSEKGAAVAMAAPPAAGSISAFGNLSEDLEEKPTTEQRVATTITTPTPAHDDLGFKKTINTGGARACCRTVLSARAWPVASGAHRASCSSRGRATAARAGSGVATAAPPASPSLSLARTRRSAPAAAAAA